MNAATAAVAMNVSQRSEDDSFRVPACGKQADSMKKNGPIWSMPKAGRDEQKKVFLSKNATQDIIGRDSPGFAYHPRRIKMPPKWSFGTADARPPMTANKYPETWNDLNGRIPDSQAVKYHQRSTLIGTLKRGAPSNAPDLKGYPVGSTSPGPQQYDPLKGSAPYSVRLGHAPEIDKIPPSYSMGMKTKILELESQSGTEAGPGKYAVAEACGAQALSVKKSLPQWSVNKRDRFPDQKVTDSGKLWDPYKDQKERNCRSFSSAPSFSFGRSTRDHAKKVARCETAADKGPVGQLDRFTKSHPELPSRHEIMRLSLVPSG